MAAGVREEMPGGALPHLVGGMHDQRLGEMVGQVARAIHMSVPSPLQAGPAEAEPLTHGAWSLHLALMAGCPVGPAAARSLPLQGPAHRERRLVQLLHPAPQVRV